MNFGEAVARALTRRSPHTGHGATPKTLAELERAHGGSKAAAARAAGVSPETWRRWRNGSQHPRKARLEGLEAAVRRSRLRPGRQARLSSHRPAIALSARVRKSEDSRDRTIDLGALAEPGFMDALMDAYLAGDEARQEELLEGLLDEYVPGMEVEQIHGLTIGAAGTYGDDNE